MTTSPTPPGGSFEGRLHLFPVRVYYEDTDLSGIAYHAGYLRWFERGRSDMLRLLGVDQRAAIEDGEGHYAVADLAIRYLRPARLDDVLIVETCALEIRAASIRLRQTAMRDGEPIASADVRVGFLGPDGRPKRQPESWRKAFQILIAPDKDCA
ncbi:YbgC/FadM family acyl-CoA thioesterase [Altericroceibacterium xinjiangense]|uniref:YbgC/FadM family acyl-CoA thioesterase n=1 Tax=Altericroceibacterium xinjiangense TaxID=762261 RepID=UPI000F7EA40F|nr:YbgC/FadM family acyl-CoA thioesterase [Altericroceibacterium xinjiangense]